MSMKRRAAVVLASIATAAAVSIAPATAAAPNVTSLEKVRNLVGPSVVYLETYYTAYVKDPSSGWLNKGYPFKWGIRCTGVVVNPTGYIATAGHCVDTTADVGGAKNTAVSYGVQSQIDAGILDASKSDQQFQYGIESWIVQGKVAGSEIDRQVYVQYGVAVGGQKTGAAVPARVVDVRAFSQGDIAMLKVEKALPASLIASADSIDIGTDVVAIGYPGSSDDVTDQSLEPTFKDGKVNAKKTREGGLLPVYEISAATSGGMSGGPVVNLKGEVLGLVSFGNRTESQAFNFLTPASIVSEILARAGVKNELSATDRTYRSALQAYYRGDGKVAQTGFQSVLDAVPGHPQAQDLLGKSKTLAASQKSSSPTMLIGIIVAVVAVAGGAFFMLRRKRGGPAQVSSFPVVQAPAEAVAPIGAPILAQVPEPLVQVPPVTIQLDEAAAPEQPVPVTTIAASVSEERPADANPVGFRAAAPAAPQQAAPQQAAPQQAAPALGRVCSSCGAGNVADAHFCSRCGRAVA